ncbi:heavy-metal-associated domain-containing protein [Microdochium bolleyi]|uniref:Superoxide dismutase 1 copper chaperone n=1 Tax=Microdochium bolleyi TaxID=196109 RepID=A0A136JB77_9PEZI|nr:heavy-metal-associated domain-containing protein [Microdochium bolleyi]
MAIQGQAKTPFQTLFAVHMTCESCVNSVTDSLNALEGVNRVHADLEKQQVTVEGTAAPSSIVSAIEATGRDAILRGSGTTDGAAVCILETFHKTCGSEAGPLPSSTGQTNSWIDERNVRGLARMVSVSPTTTIVDLTIHGVQPGTYNATIREYGNLQHGAASTGPAWGGDSNSSSSSQPRGLLGTIEVGADGKGFMFTDHPLQVWEIIGHAMVVSQQDVGKAELENNDSTVLGVVARSAGMWDNDKAVCSCTGKTLWEERKDQVSKGMI